MTIEEILDCSAEQLKAMSDEELLKHFQQYLCVTRPELAAKERKDKVPIVNPIFHDPKKKAALEALAATGIDISFIRRRKR
jgi:hypothetical protein